MRTCVLDITKGLALALPQVIESADTQSLTVSSIGFPPVAQQMC